MAKRLTLTGTGLRSRPHEQKAAIVAAVREELWPAIEDGRVRPVVDQVLPMSEAAEAHRLLEASGHIGKLLLQPSEAAAAALDRCQHAAVRPWR